jgi:hypothetical protein
LFTAAETHSAVGVAADRAAVAEDGDVKRNTGRSHADSVSARIRGVLESIY